MHLTDAKKQAMVYTLTKVLEKKIVQPYKELADFFLINYLI